MNNRQNELLKYLKENKERYVSKKTICREIPMAYPRHLENNNNEGNKSTAFSNISSDVRTINDNENINFVIIYKAGKGYKIGNQEETKDYIERRFKRDLKALKLDWKLVKKVNLNNQITMDDEELRIIKAFEV